MFAVESAASKRARKKDNVKPSLATKSSLASKPLTEDKLILKSGEIRTRSMTLLAMALLLSGAAALIYQILWIRQLSLVVGVEVYSITIAVSAFFTGLAAGSLVFGRMADRWQNPLRMYAILEICIGLSGVAITFLLPHTAWPFVALQGSVGVLAWLLPFLLVSAPAFLMGGTLPVMIRSVAQGQSTVATAGGWIYAVNTAGGIAGALLSTFVFLRYTGIHNTAIVAAVFNLAAAAIAFFVNRTVTDQYAAPASTEGELFPAPSGQATLALILYAVSGAVALGYEVVWSQALAQFMSTRVFAFSVVLATYLAGLAIGSALYARWGHRVRDTWGIFALLITSAGVIALLEIAALGTAQLRIQYSIARLALSATGSEFARMSASFAVASFGIVFLPTLLLGAAFPVLLQLTARGTRIGTDTGTVLALNTAGGIAGSLLTGFILIPTLGLVRTLGILAIVAALVGVLAVLLGTNVLIRWKSAVGLLALGVVATSIMTRKTGLRGSCFSRAGAETSSSIAKAEAERLP
jgi:spermidine synthase